MGKSSSTSTPSPNPNITTAATNSANTGQDWLNFAQGAYGQQQNLQNTVNSVSGTAEGADQTAATNAGQAGTSLTNQAVSEMEPLTSQYVTEAENYGSTANQNAQAAQAGATVAQNAALQQQQTNQQLSAMGVNPNSGAYVGEQNANALNTAVAEAGAETSARQATQQAGLGLESSALGSLNTEAGTGLSASGLGVNASTSAANTANAAANTNVAGTSIMDEGYTGAETGEANEGNILNTLYSSQANAALGEQQLQAQEEESLFGGLGSLAGIGMLSGALSSREWKTHKRPSRGNLRAVRALPIERWRYAPGIADGGKHEHTGTYAEDFKKHTGHGDGRHIPFSDAIGITMGAVKELAGQVDQVKRAIKAREPKATKHPASTHGVHKPHVIAVLGIKPPHLHMAHPPHVHAKRTKMRRFSIRQSI